VFILRHDAAVCLVILGTTSQKLKNHNILNKLSRLTRVEKAVKNTTIVVKYKVLMYIQISANYMFRPLLVRPSSGWIP